MELAQTNDLVRFQSEAHNYLTRYYTLTGNAEKASSHLDRYHILNDSLINADKNEQIANMQVKYNTEKQIQQNEILTQENEILELQRNRQRVVSYGSLAFLMLTLLAGIFGYRAYRNKQKNTLNAQLVKEREKGLRVMLKSIEDERQRIAKDLHDGVGQQMTALKLQYNTLRGKLSGSHDKELDDISSLLNETGKEIRSVSHQMMPRALMELGLIPAVEDMLRKSLDSTGISYHFESLGKAQKVDKQVEVGLYRIAQELVNNVIKHSKADHVDFQILFRPHSLIMTIEYNGVGMKKTKKEGIGLMNIMSRLNAISGEARYEDAKDHGTIAVIRIPLSNYG
jgi:signal transduction histidine kinase